MNELLYLESGKMWQHFGDVTVDELEIEELNGININAFLDNVIRKSKPQTLKGLLECDKVIFKDVVVNELNGGKLDVMYMTTNTNQTISAPVIFKSDVFVNGPIRMRDTATVNGIDISELPNICVMKTGNQIIRGRKSFREIIPLKGIKTEGENERVLDLLLRKGISS